ncbi:Six-hairpin glycosidase-like protein [Aspergillus californicus]
MKISPEEQKTINTLQSNWIWTPNWTDSAPTNTAGQIVRFTRPLTLSTPPTKALLHFSADTRYKLLINGVRVTVGPARGSPWLWYYDTLDIAPFLREGRNEVRFDVLRYFAAGRGAMPFQRTAVPGLTVSGCVWTEGGVVCLDSARGGWVVCVQEGVSFPMGLVDDVFLHINERVTPAPAQSVTPVPYGLKTLNGELAPWRLRPRVIPMYEESRVAVDTVRSCRSTIPSGEWEAWLATGKELTLAEGSSHTLEIQADVHSTAFLRWTFRAQRSSIRMKVTYSEGYELEPRAYPFFRTKADRLDAENGHLVGPFDEVVLDVDAEVVYEPFWFRTFRLLRLELTVGSGPVSLVAFEATQVNYPMAVKARWEDASDPESQDIWAVSIRTMRNCMFDGYSDCPFYEQLQYSGDSRSVGLFHYFLSGDDRLMRQAITNFAASITAEGLTQSRFPSHVPQVIAGFSLYWILQVCDHHLFFGDTAFSRSFLPRIDGVLDFFDSHIDALGLVSGLPEDVWQYVDWVTTWGATDSHPDKGVPTSGRGSNRHTYFSLLYAYVLQHAARLARDVGRPGYAGEYESRAGALQAAVREHCYDGVFFTDSTADVAGPDAYSQHCQVFAVLSGTAVAGDSARILTEALANPRFSKCSYMMRFYALRALAIAGDEVYEGFWAEAWGPWRKMLANNLSTWEEDDVRQRSDCHAWGSVPIYEYCAEVAGIQPIAAGCRKVLFKPRLGLSRQLTAKVALGRDNLAVVSWTGAGGEMRVDLSFENPVDLVSRFPGGDMVEHGVVSEVTWSW